MLIKIAHNAVHAKLIEPERKAKLLVSEMLSYKVEGAEHMGMTNWNGTSSFYDMRKDSFPAGFVRMIKKKLELQGHKVQVVSKPLPEPLGEVLDCLPHFGYDKRYAYQSETVRRLLRLGGMIAQCATGCHEKGQKVIMFDGSLKNVEDVEVGDQLMGPDSRPRNVMRLCRGEDEMYRITPLRYGKSFVVNGEHILSLEQTKLPENRLECLRNGEHVELTVNEYLEKNKTFKHIHKLHRSKGIEFEEHNVHLAPYMLGLFIGDGSIKTTPKITSADQEIIDYCIKVGESMGLSPNLHKKAGGKATDISMIRTKGTKCENPITAALKYYGLWGTDSGTKFIPDSFKLNSEDVRLKVLAGLIDTDGHLHNGGYEYVTKSVQLGEDVAFVARSLGFAVSIGTKEFKEGRYAGNTYSRIMINGNVSRIPVKIERKKTDERKQKKEVHLSGFDVEHIGKDEYYGFQLDDDHLYMLDDFTITHNSGKSVICQLAYHAIRCPTLFITTRKTLMYQMADGFEQISKMKTGIIGDGKYKPAHITCATVDTIVSHLEVVKPETYLGRRVEAIEEEANKAAKNALRRAKLPTSDNIIRTAPADIKKKVAKVREDTINAVRAKYDKDAIWKEAVDKANAQIKRRKQMLRFLETIEFVVLEEAHEISGNGYYDILGYCVNAYYRLALTATPFLKDSQEANMRLMARTGPIGITVTERELIDKGILARPYFKYITISAADKVYRSTAWQKAYKLGIVENKTRNLHIINECRRAKAYGLPIMLLVTHKEHGKWLEMALNKVGVRARFIFGEHEQEERKDALDALKNGEIDCVIGSTILDVGVDVPAVGLVILAGGGKAEVSHRQRIGRGLRAKKIGPNVCFVVDFMDMSNNHLKKHSQMRKAAVEETDGFKQGIVSSFNYESHGFKRTA